MYSTWLWGVGGVPEEEREVPLSLREGEMGVPLSPGEGEGGVPGEGKGEEEQQRNLSRSRPG